MKPPRRRGAIMDTAKTGTIPARLLQQLADDTGSSIVALS
jgi:hypothetical protein